MKELIKKYGHYEFCDGNLYIVVSDKELVRPNMKDVVISFSNNIIILTATEHFYEYFFEEYKWDKWCDENIDLEGKSIDDVTRITRIWKKRVVNVSWLKLKKTKELHLESSNWTLKILDDVK